MSNEHSTPSPFSGPHSQQRREESASATTVMDRSGADAVNPQSEGGGEVPADVVGKSESQVKMSAEDVQR